MSDALQLAAIASLESVAYLLRYRSATERSAVVSGFHTLMICSLRTWFIVAGASAVMRDANPAVLVIAYAGTAAVVTAIMHEVLERRKERLS